jgi:O-antigen/teichoic acid export membrane protein
MFVPVILRMLIGGELILRLFGPQYADAGAGLLLRYFAIGLAPFTIVTLDRSRERFADALLITSVRTVTAGGLDMVLIPRHGIVGAGLGWLIGQTLAALVAIRTLRHELAPGRAAARAAVDPGRRDRHGSSNHA